MSSRHYRSHVRICWLATFGVVELGDPMPKCDGRLVRCHLIPKTMLRDIGIADVWDRRVWVWGCGGPMGDSGHHGMLDRSRKLRLPREAIPPGTEEFALEHGLMWFLDTTYGERRAA